MSRQSLRNMFAAAAISAIALGAALAPTDASAFGRGGGFHFGGNHFAGNHFGGRNWGRSPTRPQPVPIHWPRPHPWPIGCHGFHCGHGPHRYGIYGGVEDATVVQVAPPVQAVVSCPTPVADGSFIMVAFVPTATAAEITSFLQSYKADISDGPDADGIYRVKVSAERLSRADMENLIASIKEQTAVVRYVAA
ncbi:MAG: hypothetical protein ACLPID_19590 [Beijerinckiaceae bacterium]